MSRKKVFCQFDCGREAKMVKHNGIATTCNACYMRMRYAMEKGPTWMLRRMRQVGSWQSSLASCMGDVAPARLKKKRSRAA